MTGVINEPLANGRFIRLIMPRIFFSFGLLVLKHHEFTVPLQEMYTFEDEQHHLMGAVDSLAMTENEFANTRTA